MEILNNIGYRTHISLINEFLYEIFFESRSINRDTCLINDFLNVSSLEKSV